MSAKRKTKKKAPEFDYTIFREGLAKAEREQWAYWASTILEQEEGLSVERRERWKENMAKEWDELTEEEKALDYTFADVILRVLIDGGMPTLIIITEYLLDTIYPASVFTGKSGDLGPKFVVELRETLEEIKKVSK